MMRLLLLFLGSIALAACSGKKPDPVVEDGPHPALWEIRDETGKPHGWLFGTIHSLPDDTAWRSPLFVQTVEQADKLVVEVANLGDREELTRLFEQMAYDHPDGPISQRIAPKYKGEFEELLVKAKVRRGYFDRMESWAAALTLAQLAQTGNSENGVDRSLLKDFSGREIVELEGAKDQLSIFDQLPAGEQRDLLNAVLEESASYGQEIGELANTWGRGDTTRLAELTRRGILSDPELRQALLVDRNKAWAAQIENLLSAPGKPLIAVGAGHLLGPDGLPALLEKRGYSVERIQ